MCSGVLAQNWYAASRTQQGNLLIPYIENVEKSLNVKIKQFGSTSDLFRKVGLLW